MCSNAKDNSLNELHSCENSTTTITLKYSPYMNWGRWNHNPSRVEPLLRALKTAQYSVQLQHDEVETTWENHGYVTLSDEAGNKIAHSDDFQHNGRNRTEQTALILQQVNDALSGSGKASNEDTTDEEVESESSLKAWLWSAIGMDDSFPPAPPFFSLSFRFLCYISLKDDDNDTSLVKNF